MQRSRILTREHVAMVGDALLMTSAVFGLFVGLSALIIAPEGTPRPGTEWVAAVSSIASLLVGVIVPLVVWLAHGRRLTLWAVVGALLGAFCTGFVFMALTVVAALVGLVVGPFADSEFAGPVVVLVAVSFAYLSLVAWLVVDAVRDLPRHRRNHASTDAMRLVSACVVAAVLVGSLWWMSRHPGDESWELMIFAMVAGIGGALAVTGALVATAVAAGQRRGRRDLGISSPPTAPTRGG